MRWSRTIEMVECHAEGEVGRVVTGAVLDLPGATVLDRMNHINNVDDSLRRFLVFEPRGYPAMSTNLLFPPSSADADAAFLILQADRAHAMSGSNAICVTTVLLETGILPMVEPETVVRLETPAGIVRATAECRDGRCLRVSLDMTPGFVEALDLVVEVHGLGPVTLDVAFGGVFYALIDPRQLGLRIVPDQARALVEAGARIHQELDRALTIRHPEIPSIEGISYPMFVDRTDAGDLVGATVMGGARIDRSPCGTGNTARMAVRHSRGEIAVGDRAEVLSIIGSRFGAELRGLGEVAGRTSTLTRISGRGFVHGLHRVGIDPADPYPQGHALSDIWGEQLPP